VAKLLRAPRADVAVLAVTFLLTVLIDLTVAIQIGVALAAFLFLARLSDTTEVRVLRENLTEIDDELVARRAIGTRSVPAGVQVFELTGSLFFVAVERFQDAIRRVAERPRVLILRMRLVPTIDASGLRALEDLHERTSRHGGTLLLTGVGPGPLAAMERAGFLERIGRENVMPDIDAALARARALLGPAGELPPQDAAGAS
jgi:SulP family sulfate permease